MTTERVLTKAGYLVTCAADGDEALLTAEKRVPDLIILDMLLPKLSGPEVLHSLKKNVITADIPVLVLSSLSQRNEGKLLAEGAAAFLEKGPMLDHPELLLGAIHAALMKGGIKDLAREY